MLPKPAFTLLLMIQDWRWMRWMGTQAFFQHATVEPGFQMLNETTNY